MSAAIDPRRRAVVRAAMAEVGKTDQARYWAVALPGGDLARDRWCGAFALWALAQAGLALRLRYEVRRGGFMFQLPRTADPLPGDVAYIGARKHHAIVVRLEGDELVTVDGCVQQYRGATASRKGVYVRRRPTAAVGAYCSIAPLLAKGAA